VRSVQRTQTPDSPPWGLVVVVVDRIATE
jgi:hypothetical protein